MEVITKSISFSERLVNGSERYDFKSKKQLKIAKMWQNMSPKNDLMGTLLATGQIQ
ncbi:hypothetical protein ES703_77912 [subsurface metagenome]